MLHAPTIRDAVSDDRRVLARIHLDSRAAAMPWLAILHNDQETETWMSREVLPHQRVRVATVEDAAVGFAAFDSGWLNQLYVLPKWQKRGIGGLLFLDACTAARNSFQLWVFQRNVAARRFYERHGCRLLKLTDGNDNEECEPDALYEKSLR